MSRKGPDGERLSPSDRHVAARIRERRIMLGLTQHEAADRTGVTYQQIHKYETGINRISAGRLYVIASGFGVDVQYFFEGLERDRPSAYGTQQQLILEVAGHFSRITNHRHKEAFVAFARALARLDGEPDGDRDGDE